MKTTIQKNDTLQVINRFIKGWSLQVLFCTTLIFTPLQSIFSHGTVTSPPSRVWICFQENPESPDSPACIAAIQGYGTQAFYDWNEVARMDAFGMHMDIIMDGNLASAGRPDKYGGLDQVRDDWVTTAVTPGPFTVTWTNSAPHQTLYYDVYITKASWTPDQPLTWDSLERLVRTDPRPAAATDNIDVVLPQRTGKHVIYSIWQRSLTGEAFYSTSDVDFGNEPIENLPPVASFTSDNGRCGGPNVAFSAGDSFDPNGDALTYFWDFGDGTTAEGVSVSHSYTNLDSATVTLTVSDQEFSSGTVQTISLLVDPQCSNPICPFDTPSVSPLPSINKTYENIYVIGNGPNLDNVTNFTINWILGNNGLYQFSMSTNNGTPNWYNDLLPVSTQNFNLAEPQITLTNSGFEGLDGSYYATLDGENFVLVSIDSGFTIYFSSSTTPPLCDGPNDPTNTPPVASLIATPDVGITPLEVLFDASGSTDADNDVLTYSINYGNGTTGTGVTSSHIYTTGTYTATVTVNDGNGGTDTASVNITVNDDVIIVDPPTGDCTFGAPINASLATLNTTYENTYVLGTGGPDLDVVTKFTINWDLANNGLYQFSFNLNIAPWYINFSNATQNFSTSNPEISLIGTGIPGLDGDYFATIDNGNFVLVASTYTIYFSNSATAPNCESTATRSKNGEDLLVSMFPNPAVNSISIQSKLGLQNANISITDLSGTAYKSLRINEKTKRTTIDVSGMRPGLYFVRIIDHSGSSKTLRLLIN